MHLHSGLPRLSKVLRYSGAPDHPGLSPPDRTRRLLAPRRGKKCRSLIFLIVASSRGRILLLFIEHPNSGLDELQLVYGARNMPEAFAAHSDKTCHTLNSSAGLNGVLAHLRMMDKSFALLGNCNYVRFIVSIFANVSL